MNIELAMKYTDLAYCNKNEVSNSVGNYSSENVWKVVCDYRDKYRFPLDIKLYEQVPSTVVLTPQIMAIANSLDCMMCEYYSRLNLLSVYERFSDEKRYTYFKNECLKNDLFNMANLRDVDINKTTLETVLDYAKFKNLTVKNYHDAYKFLIDNQDLAFDKHTLREIVRFFNMGVDNPNFYRDEDVDFDELGCNYSRIVEHLQMLFNLYNSNFELSPFIISSIIMIYFVYVNPLKTNTKEVAALLFNKALQTLGYHEASYLISVSPLFYNDKYMTLKDKINEYKRTGDITYPLYYVLTFIKEQLKERKDLLDEVPLPTLYQDGIKVVEKEVPVEVVKEVVKEVPVEVEKEVIKEVEVPVEVVKEVPVEVIKEVEVPVEVEKEVIKEVPVEVVKEVVKEVPYETIKEVIKEVPVEVIKEVTVYKDRPVEVIKEVEVPVEVIKEVEKEVIKEVPVEVEKEVIKEVPVEVIKEVEVPVEVIKEVPVEVIKEVVKEVPVEVIKEVIKEVPVEVVKEVPSISKEVEENNDNFIEEPQVNEVITPKVEPKKEITSIYRKFSKEEIRNIQKDGNIANRLVQLNPYIRDYQARYYEQNHDYGMFYTISSFKDFAYCAYETARTSMDFLCEIGLYEKRQIKNKFIYTPVSLEE